MLPQIMSVFLQGIGEDGRMNTILSSGHEERESSWNPAGAGCQRGVCGVSSSAALIWDELNFMPGMGSKKARDLLEMIAAAA